MTTTGLADVQDDLLLIVRRVEALGKFLDTDDGKNLLAGIKRAANILRIEEKKDKRDIHRRAGRQALSSSPRKRRWPPRSTRPRRRLPRPWRRKISPPP